MYIYVYVCIYIHICICLIMYIGLVLLSAAPEACEAMRRDGIFPGYI